MCAAIQMRWAAKTCETNITESLIKNIEIYCCDCIGGEKKKNNKVTQLKFSFKCNSYRLILYTGLLEGCGDLGLGEGAVRHSGLLRLLLLCYCRLLSSSVQSILIKVISLQLYSQ